MPVSFNQVPGSLRVPFFYAEINAGAAPFDQVSKLLLIGQKLAAGSATANVPIRFRGNAVGLFGAGSMLAQMCDIAQLNADPLQEIWCLPVADNGTTKAAGDFTVSSAATSIGTLSVYIAGQKVSIAVTPTMTTVQVAAALVAAINAGDVNGKALPVLATQGVNPNDNKCLLTALNAGTLGNKIRLETDIVGDEGPLAAIMITPTAMSAGATDVSLSTPLAALGETEFDFICTPYTDSTNVGLMTTFLNGQTGRWSPSQQLYGVAFSAKDDTSSNLATSGSTLNDPNLTIMGYNKGSSPPWSWAAAYAAVATRLQFASEVSRPMQTLPLLGIIGPKLLADRFTQTQRAALYVDGIASYKVLPANQVVIDRAITTYQFDNLGAVDLSWLDVESRFQAMFVVRYMRQKITQQHGRNALREDNPLRLPNVSTPDNIRDTIVHGYRELSNANLVENFEAFANGLVVERNTSDPSRVDVFLPVDLVNGLRIFAVNATFFQNIQGNDLAAA